MWKNEARFKHLSAADAEHEAALASFGMIIGGLVLRATPRGNSLGAIGAEELRDAILSSQNFVDLQSLLATCWALGVPVVHLRVFPLETKAMHAMVVQSEGRFAILLGRDSNYPAPIAFTLAHEIGHIAQGHVGQSPALVDMDELDGDSSDDQEKEADTYGLTLLTGRGDPAIETNVDQFNSTMLAKAVLDAAPRYRIEPGALALCLAYRRKAWPVAMAALRLIYPEPREVWREVNSIADLQLSWDAIGPEAADYVRRILGAG